jgi:hypothetical protein
MDNLRAYATLGTRNWTKLNVRGNRRGNQEWIIQRYKQHRGTSHRTRTNTQHRKLKRRSTKNPRWNPGTREGQAETSTVLLIKSGKGSVGDR